MKKLITALLLCALSRPAWAAGEPVPGALNSQTLRLPDGPGSVRGLGDAVSVDGFSAQVRYGVPFELPKGVAGFAPSLALSYSGELGNGPVGVGWSLPVMSIRRSLRQGVPMHTAADELELVGIAGGGRLVALADGTWRLEGRGQAVKVERSGAGFLVTESGGVRYRLGTVAAARQEEVATGRVAAWFAEEVLHPAGHRIGLGYLKDGGQVYPASLTWGPQDAFLVELFYEARPDLVVGYRTGFRVDTAKRLKEVRVTSFGEVLRAYHLTYEDSFALSRLARVRMTGRGGVGALPEVAFSYAPPAAEQVVKQTGVDGWVLNTRGVSLVDVDGDGMSDLLRTESTGHSYKKGTGTAFAAPVTLTGPATGLSDVKLMDVNGDTRPELVRYLSSAWRPYRLDARAWVDMGSKWLGSDNMSLTDTTFFYADLNGDGRVDVVQGLTSGIRVKLNSPTGLGAWVSRPYIGGGPAQVVPGPNVRFHDVNGDGLADVVQLTDSLMRVYLGRGDGHFVLQGSYNHPWGTGSFPLADVRLCDLNRDGLMDVVRLSASHVYWYPGRAEGGVQATARFVARPGSAAFDSVVAIADINGNGSEDVVWSSAEGLWVLDLAGTTSAGMLVGVDNGLGKTVSLGYSASAVLSVAAEAAGRPWEKRLPVSVPVPVTVTVQPGAGEPVRVVEHGVRDGFWDAEERRFGGFLTSIRRTLGDTLARTLVEQTRYHAGLGAERVLRGLPVEVRTEDGAGQLFTVATSVYQARAVEGLPDVALLRKPALVEQRTRHHEGLATPVETLVTYGYDTRVRPVEEVHAGRLDLTGDEKTVRRAFASDDTVWVQDVVCEERVLEADGTLVSHSRIFYGDATQVFTWTDVAACRAGRLVREEYGWLEDATAPRWVLMRAAEYSAWDNPTRLYEQGAWRTLEYDVNHLHPTVERVQPSPERTLTWTLQWDDVLGMARRLTRPDGVADEVTYDSLGRPVAIATAGAPAHVHYTYDWTAPAPRTTTHVFDGDDAQLRAEPTPWTPGPNWRETVDVANGAGEKLFAATRLGSRWIINDWKERDARGKVTFLADPFYWDGSALPSARPASSKGQGMTYDAQGRLLTQSLPNGAVRSFSHRAFESTQSEPELAPVTRQWDGLERTILTQRQVGATLETVEATYDAASRIRALRLQGGAVTHAFTYDSLGRMVFAQDPDIGPRTLRYDDQGRLTQHINGANQARQYFYDGAGRLVRTMGEDGAAFVYHYDVNQDGSSTGHVASRMAWVEEPNGEAHFAYDAMGRQVAFRRVIDVHQAEELTTYSASGLVLASTVDGASIATTYDAAGRPTRVGTYWEALQLDASGRALEERYGNGVRQVYERDELGMARRIQALRSSGVALYDVTLTRNANGSPLTVTDTDGRGVNHSATFTYDTAARLTDAVLGAVLLPDGKLGEGSGSYRFGYGYDGLQNMVRRQAAGPQALDLLAGTYHYGERGFGPRQLTRVASASGETLLDYDGAGREVRQGQRLMTYNGLDQLVRVTWPVGGNLSVVEHAYGHDGLRVMTRGPDGATQYWFTSQLTLRPQGSRDRYVKLGERTVARVAYTLGGALGPLAMGASTPGPDGATLDMAVGHALSWLMLAALLMVVLAVRGPARGRGRRVVAGLLAVALLGQACDPGVQALHLSALRQAQWEEVGTLYFQTGVAAGPALITRADGSVHEERRYEPFGAPVAAYREFVGGGSAVGTVDHADEPLNALNRLTDVHTGWSDHGARWMAPQTGRWLTADPPVKAPDPVFLRRPWDLHPYQYVRQNPLFYWDPDGRQAAGSDEDYMVQEARRVRGWQRDNTQEGLEKVRPVADAAAGMVAPVAAAGLVRGETPSGVRMDNTEKALTAVGLFAGVLGVFGKLGKSADELADLAKTGDLAASIRWKGFYNNKLSEHFEKHVLKGKEFGGNITQNQYMKMAKDFALEKGAGFKEEMVGNFVVKYDPATRRTLVGHLKDREIRTFYEADFRDADPFAAAVDLAKQRGGGTAP